MTLPRFIEPLRLELLDLSDGLARWRVWATLAWFDIKTQYSRSWLGPVWTLASLLFFVLVVGLLYTKVLDREPGRYIPHLALGWIIWAFVSNSILHGCNALINAKQLIKEMPLPISVHIFRTIGRNAIIFLYHSPVVLVMLYNFSNQLPIKLAVLALSLMLIVGNILWISIVLGIICTRYHDIFEILTNLIRISFLLTPIIWMPDMVGFRTYLLDFNPFYHVIEIFRGPLLGQWPRAISWWTMITALVLGWPLALYLLSRFRHRIPYWV